MLENLFKLKENHTSVKTEVIAGITTFMTMAYILAVNPSVLSAAGMDPTAVLLATCIASFIGTLFMGLTANLPFVLSAGMGLNAYLALNIKYGCEIPKVSAAVQDRVKTAIETMPGLEVSEVNIKIAGVNIDN